MKKLTYLFPLIIILLVSGCSIFKKNKPDAEKSIYFDSDGGEHTYSNGIILKISPRALRNGQNISISELTESEWESLLARRNVPKEKILFAFKTSPENLDFEKDVTLSIPVSGLTPTMIPMIMHIDFIKKSVLVANSSYKANAEDKTIELSVSHFTGYEGEIVDEIKRNECTDPTTSCRCGTIEVSQSDADYSCSEDDCQVLYSENTVKFLDCPGSPEESSIFEEVSPGCEPDLSLSSEKVYIEEGETCEITALLKLGCTAPLTSRNIGFSASGPGTINPTDDLTDDQGKAYTTVTGGSEEGVVTITASSSFTYYTKRINVNGVDLVKEERTVNLTKTIEVYVIKKPVLNLVAADAVIQKNDNTTITATITKDETPIEGVLVDFSVVGPAAINPFSSNTSSSGQAITQLSSHNSKGTVNVLAESIVSIVLPNGGNIQVPLHGIVNVIIEEEDPEEDIISFWTFNHHYENFVPPKNESNYQYEGSNTEENLQGTFRIVKKGKKVGEGTALEYTVYEYIIEGSASGHLTAKDGATKQVTPGFTQTDVMECSGGTYTHSVTYELTGDFDNGRISLIGKTEDLGEHDGVESVVVGTCVTEHWDQTTDERWKTDKPDKTFVLFTPSFSYRFDEDENWVRLDYVSEDGRTKTKTWVQPIE